MVILKKKINGKLYKYFNSYGSYFRANSEAKRLRKKGKSVRVIDTNSFLPTWDLYIWQKK